MNKQDLINQLKQGLVVSCQALPSEPMYSKTGGIMPLFAKAAFEAGAVGIRANSVRDIKEIKEQIPLPIIGIIKQVYPNSEAYITPTMREIDDLIETGCEIIATDFTTLTRENGLSATEFLKEIKKKYPKQCIMADCATLEDAIAADQAGIDFIGTTMNGYTNDSSLTEGPNFELITQIIKSCKAPVIAEGRIHFPDQARQILDLGVLCVVVGGAITRPKEITERFMKAIKK